MWLEGRGLHGGRPARARFRREPGPLCVRRVDGGAAECVVGPSTLQARARSSLVILPDGRTVDTVEHALAAVVARGCFADLVLEVAGPELPLLDGGARAWAEALARTGAVVAGPVLRVQAPACFTAGRTELRLRPGRRAVEVLADFGARGLPVRRCRWDDDWEDFVRRVAPARTFGFLDEAAALLASGRAWGADPAAVVVYGPDGRPDPRFAVPADDGEPARHKLLDVLGDLALAGARIEGGVELAWPGHAGTQQALRAALAAGVLEA